jgi:hypothetical protein
MIRTIVECPYCKQGKIAIDYSGLQIVFNPDRGNGEPCPHLVSLGVNYWLNLPGGGLPLPVHSARWLRPHGLLPRGNSHDPKDFCFNYLTDLDNDDLAEIWKGRMDLVPAAPYATISLDETDTEVDPLPILELPFPSGLPMLWCPAYVATEFWTLFSIDAQAFLDDIKPRIKLYRDEFRVYEDNKLRFEKVESALNRAVQPLELASEKLGELVSPSSRCCAASTRRRTTCWRCWTTTRRRRPPASE